MGALIATIWKPAVVAGVLTLAGVVFVLVQMYRQNRRLFWSAVGAGAAHVALVGLVALVALLAGKLVGPLKLAALLFWGVLLVTGVVFGGIRLYQRSRLLVIALAAALCLHLFIAAAAFAFGHFMNRKPAERYAEVQFRVDPPPTPPTPEKKVEEPKPKDDMIFEVPLGDMRGDPNVTKIRRGTTLQPLDSMKDVGRSSDPSKPRNARAFGPRNPMTTPVGDPADADIWDPGGDGPPNPGQDGDDPTIKPWEANDLPGGGGGGKIDWGVPDGDLGGGVPRGFADGKAGGNIYFLRLKTQNNGAWNAHNDGTKRLLAFFREDASLKMNAKTDTWPMDAKVLTQLLDEGNKGVPSFLYIYADERFSLGDDDVRLLKRYMGMGGFLFIDSRPSLAIKNLVADQLRKIFPTTPLAPIAESHPIRTFHFQITGPGTGQDLIEKQNFGISKDGKLVVFYTKGNFSTLFENYDFRPKDQLDQVVGTYQMGANVMLYAIRKGNAEGVTKVRGSNTAFTLAMLEKLGGVAGTSTTTTTRPTPPGNPANPGNGTGVPTAPPEVPVGPPEVEF